MFASGGLGEKGVPRAVICVFAGVGVYATVEAEAVLKTVAMRRENVSITRQALINPRETHVEGLTYSSQAALPSCTPA